MNFINLICIYFTLFLPLSSAIPILNFAVGGLMNNENEIRLRSKFAPILESKAINSSSIMSNTIPHSTSISVEIPSPNNNYSKEEVELVELDMWIGCKKRGITEKVEKTVGKHWFDALVGVRLMTNLGRTHKRNSTLQYAGKGGKNSGKGGGGGNEESTSSGDHRTSRGTSKGVSS